MASTTSEYTQVLTVTKQIHIDVNFEIYILQLVWWYFDLTLLIILDVASSSCPNTLSAEGGQHLNNNGNF